MKRIIMVLVLLLMCNVNKLYAETYYDYLPGGKNYIDEDNININLNHISLINQIKIKPDTTYTLSMPGVDDYGIIKQLTMQTESIYYDDYLEELPGCVVDSDLHKCVFHTGVSDTYLSLELEADYLSDYIGYSGSTHIQLEEGSIASSYEVYVEPDVELNDNTAPVISGSGGIITSYQNITLINDIISQHISAYDEIDGDLSESIIIVSDEYTNNEQIIGTYEVLLSVKDSSNNTSQFSLLVMVKDQIKPIITCDEIVYVNVDDGKTTLELIGDEILFTDEYDNNPSFEVSSNTYQGNEEVIGTYTFTLSVTDSSGNIASQLITVSVTDYEAPTLVSNVNIIVDYDDFKEHSEIIDSLLYTDNYDLIPIVEIIETDYIKEVLGTFFTDIKLSDSSGNENFITLKIDVVDTAKPSILGPNKLTISYKEVWTNEDFKNLYTITDNVDDLLISDIVITSNTYDSNTDHTGTHIIVLEVSDSSGNKSIIELELTVIDDVSPVFLIDEYIIVLDGVKEFTENDALNLLLSSRLVTSDYNNIEVIMNEYKGNESKPGNYKYVLKLSDQHGNVQTKEMIIQVKEENVKKDNNLLRTGAVTFFILSFSTFVFVLKKK